MKNFQQIYDELNSLDPKDLGAWPTYVYAGIVTFVVVLILAVGYTQVVTPLLEELDAAKAQETPLKEEFERKQRKVAALDALKEQLTEMEKSFGAMLRQLPSRAEIANLLIDISQTRLANSLEEELFQPQGESPKEFYAEVPNKITVVGTFHEMGSFVSGVAALPRIVTIDQVSIAPAGGGGPSKDEVRMNAVAKTYRYLDESELAAAAPKKKRGRK